MGNDSSFVDTLRKEGTFAPSTALINKLLSCAKEIRIKPGGIVVGYGATDTGIYIVKEGIIQLLYFKGDKEVTFGFAFPGTFMCSPQSVYMNQPAVIQIESCKTASTVLRISKEDFFSMMRESNEFALWMFDIAMGQFYTSELKMIQINGSAEERYRNLLRFRPDIASAISSNRMASYLGVTPSWLCKIRKKLLYE